MCGNIRKVTIHYLFIIDHCLCEIVIAKTFVMKQLNSFYPILIAAFMFAGMNSGVAQCNPVCPATGNPDTYIYSGVDGVWCFYDENGDCYNSADGPIFVDPNPFGGGGNNGGNNPLPIELGAFTAVQKDKAIELEWETYSEKNNDYFEILWSKDGKEFEVIAEVLSKGNGNTMHSYSFVDEIPLPGQNYYMLAQHDFNGNSTYSRIINVDFKHDKEIDMISVITRDEQIELNLYTEKNTDLQMMIFDMTGRMIQNNNLSLNEGINEIYAALPSHGMYVVSLFNERVHLTEKVLK